MNFNLISIIVPCYKQAVFLDECLQSVLAQTDSHWECIIVNDGSPDHTEEIAHKWTAKDNRFQYVYSENKGVSHARNLGIRHAKGTLILPLDADDTIGTTYVANAKKVFVENPQITLVYCNAEKFGLQTGKWDLADFSLLNLSRDNMIFNAAIFKKSDWQAKGGYDESMLQGLEDWEFWIALLKNGGQVVQLEEVGFYYRIKESSRQVDLNKTNKEDLFEYISIKHADFFVQQLGSFVKLQHNIKQLEKYNFKNIKSKKMALKVFFKAFLGINFFKNK